MTTAEIRRESGQGRSWTSRRASWVEGGRILAKWHVLPVSVAALIAAASAQASQRQPPWAGGSALVTPYEAKASEIAGALAGRSVSIECEDETAWRSRGAQTGFDPASTWALTPFHRASDTGRPAPDGYASFSPRACRYGDAFRTSPIEYGAKVCRHGTTTQWRTRRVVRAERRLVRVKVEGKWVRRMAKRKVRAVVRVPVQAPLYGECDDWGSTLVSVHVLTHESMHLHGLVGEAYAECLAVQVDAYVATALGADERFARAMATEFWDNYYATRTDRYRSPDCHDGGRLDLFPDRSGWPTPAKYPADVASSISAVEAAVQPADSR